MSEIQMSNADLRKQIEALKAQLASQPKSISMKVSEKGALSVYGLGRFPVTLYAGQWDRLLGQSEAIKSFLTAHKDTLATKSAVTATV